MAMESRLLLNHHGVTPLVEQQAGFRLLSSSSSSSSQRFLRGAAVLPVWSRRQEKPGARSVVVVTAARRPAQEQQEVKNDTTEYVESVAEAHGSGSSYVGSPLLWIGVGVGLSALFSFGANSVKRYAMQQMLKSMTGAAGVPGAGGFGGPVANPFGAPGANPFAGMPMPPPGAGFPFPPPPKAVSPASVSPAAAAAAVDVAPSNVTSSQPSAKSETSTTSESRKTAFTDVNASEILEREQQAAARFRDQVPSASEPTRSFFADSEVVDSRGGSNSVAGAGPSSNESWASAAGKGKQPVFTVDQLEKMMEDPTVQKMVYPYLPEEMRNPTTFKWMMQNPQYRQQLQDMLNGMGGGGPWDNRMSDMLKNFDLNSTEVKQQFEQIGLTPEEVVAKIMANPDVAVAFQNPKVQAAIMDCSTNPLNITKYQNDKEVMDVFNKISELFPGMTGSPF